MPKPLRTIIGLLLLLTTVSLATCQSLIQVTPFSTKSSSEYQ